MTEGLLDVIDLTSPFGRRDYLMVLFMYHTGLRVGETSGLNIGLVDHDRCPRCYLHLPAAICKNSHGRVFPLNEVAQVCVPTVHVQKILGHRQLSFTQVYCTVTKEELAKPPLRSGTPAAFG